MEFPVLGKGFSIVRKASCAFGLVLTDEKHALKDCLQHLLSYGKLLLEDFQDILCYFPAYLSFFYLQSNYLNNGTSIIRKNNKDSNILFYFKCYKMGRDFIVP